MSCPNCNNNQNCTTCSGCSGGCHSNSLNNAEKEMLQQFSTIPFLPVAAKWDMKQPIYLEEPTFLQDICSAALNGLKQKGFIHIDYDIPLTNFNYRAYHSYPLQGSMALTAEGQDMLDQLNLTE